MDLRKSKQQETGENSTKKSFRIFALHQIKTIRMMLARHEVSTKVMGYTQNILERNPNLIK